jgi:hypothetical protein
MVNNMIKKTFKRVEQKYLLTEEKYLAIQSMIEQYFLQDKYYFSKIYNLYFDNDNFDSIINSKKNKHRGTTSNT